MRTPLTLTLAPFLNLTLTLITTGCLELLDAVTRRIRPALHVFGHIHEGYGATTNGVTTFANASTCNINYQPDNPPLVFDVPLPNPDQHLPNPDLHLHTPDRSTPTDCEGRGGEAVRGRFGAVHWYVALVCCILVHWYVAY